MEINSKKAAVKIPELLESSGFPIKFEMTELFYDHRLYSNFFPI
jgi:hypothetical protein